MPRSSCILDTVAAWCNKRGQGINPMKTKILHFRPKRKPCSSLCFHLGNSTLNFAYDYKYLGFWLTQFLNMEESISRSLESTNRTLSLLIAKAKSNGGFSPLKFLMLQLLQLFSSVHTFRHLKNAPRLIKSSIMP